MQFLKSLGLCAAGLLLALPGLPTRASSHSDAPLIKQDPSANLTDVYAFVGSKYGDPNKTKVLNIVVNVHPFCEPGDGVIYDRFADDALYSINITDPRTGAIVCTYNFRYSAVNPQTAPGLKNPNTILSYGLGTALGGIQTIGDAHQNFTQFYTVTKVVGGTSTMLNGSQTLICAPPNPGARATPLYNDANGVAVSGATTEAGLDPYTKQAVYGLNTGETVFSGQREDSFFADAPGIFDLLNSRILVNGSPSAPGLGQQGHGVDGFKGYNVLTFAIQIPVSSLSNVPNFPSVGVYASVSRPRITLRQSGGDNVTSGPWVQVNRLGNPLFNEVLVALKDKDNYNRMSPTDDATHFATYALNPEVAFLINTVFGTTIQTTNRTDLAGIYIPDVIRVDTSTAPVPLDGQPGFNRLSFIGGDTVTNGAGASVPGGWPNGRRFGDDVVDIALTAVANGPAFKAPLLLVGDNVPYNDQAYNQVFPYAATPWGGTRNSKDSGVNVGLNPGP